MIVEGLTSRIYNAFKRVFLVIRNQKCPDTILELKLSISPTDRCLFEESVKSEFACKEKLVHVVHTFQDGIR